LAAQFFIAVTVAKSALGSFRSHHDVGRRWFADAWLTFCLHWKRAACTQFGLDALGDLSMNEKENIAHVIQCAIFAIGLQGSRFVVGASIGTTGAARFPFV
jgi:hypothetical protein